MTGEELRARREYLGIGRPEVAARLGVREDTVRAWERGKDPVPPRIASELAAMEAEAADHVDDLVDVWRRPDVRDDWAAAVVDQAMPTIQGYGRRWWRHVVIRAAQTHALPVGALLAAPDRYSGMPEQSQ